MRSAANGERRGRFEFKRRHRPAEPLAPLALPGSRGGSGRSLTAGRARARTWHRSGLVPGAGAVPVPCPEPVSVPQPDHFPEPVPVTNPVLVPLLVSVHEILPVPEPAPLSLYLNLNLFMNQYMNLCCTCASICT